ncbi:MAG: hypothetical protein M0Z78_08285, partial [Betaproteobacteria bacterium]|nr:hypothetical protein [Betaproteobacteria bacterium]
FKEQQVHVLYPFLNLWENNSSHMLRKIRNVCRIFYVQSFHDHVNSAMIFRYIFDFYGDHSPEPV